MESEEKGVKQDDIESQEASGETVEEAVSDVNPQSEAHDVCGETAAQQEGKQEESGETTRQDGQDGVEGEEERVVSKEDQRDEEEERSSGSGSEESSDEGEGEEEVERGETSARSSQWSSREERMKRLRELHKRRLDARQLNHREVVEEDRRNKLPANWEARQRRVEWEEQDEKARQEAEAAGEDYERQKMLQTSASELERLERKRKKTNPDPGFSDYAQAQFRQYDRLTKQFKPDMEAYEKQKMEMGADFYPGVNSLVHGGSGKVAKAGIERMTQDLEKQIEKRSKYSRRRAFNEGADVDYINERNMRFNKKAARYYDKYTAEIKQNLERGTAV